MCIKPLLSVLQVCANDRGKADINLWIYLVMFKIVLYSTIWLHCTATHTILHYTAWTLFIHTSQHYKRFDFDLWEKAPYYRVNTEHFLQTPVLRGESHITELLTSLIENYCWLEYLNPCEGLGNEFSLNYFAY